MNAFFLATTALALGIRHGMEWDHLAAIMDIVGASPVSATNSVLPAARSFRCFPFFGEWSAFRSTSFRLACLYAAGHAAVVAALGMVAMTFSMALPASIEPIMQRIVGTTLLLFSAYIFHSLWQFSVTNRNFRMRSRWMLLMDAVKMSRFGAQYQDCQHENPRPGCCGPRSAIAIGMIHGIGAETATQVLLLTTVSGAGGRHLTFGLFLLLCFVSGMFLSNTIIALLVSVGASTSRMTTPLMVLAGLFTATLSLWIGMQFVFGGI